MKNALVNMSNGLLELELWFLCLANLSYFWSTSRLSDLSYLWPTSVGLELSLTDVCRTWAIFDWRVTNMSYLSLGNTQTHAGNHQNVGWGNWFPRATLYDFLTRTVRTPQAQLGWGKILDRTFEKSKSVLSAGYHNLDFRHDHFLHFLSARS